MAAEAERIVDRDPDWSFLRLVRGVIEVAFRILILQVDRRRNDAVADGDSAGRHLHCARAA